MGWLLLLHGMVRSVLSLVEWFAYSCHTVMHVMAVVFRCHCLRELLAVVLLYKALEWQLSHGLGCVQLSCCNAWSGSCHTAIV